MAYQARTHWRECSCGRWAGSKLKRPATNLLFNASNSIDYCFCTATWFEVFKKAKAEELTAASRHSRLSCSKQLLIVLNFVWFSNKKLFTLTTSKNSHNIRVFASAATKNKCVGAKRILRARMTFSQFLMWQTACRVIVIDNLEDFAATQI